MKYFLLALFSIPLALAGCTPSNTAEYINPENVSYELESEIDVTNQEAVEEAAKVIEINMAAAESEDLDLYVTTIVSKAHENTREELSKFYEQYDLEHTILSINLLEEEEDTLLFEVFQQSVATYTSEEAEGEYRDHLAVAHHTLVLEDGEWKISETAITDTYFIEE